MSSTDHIHPIYDQFGRQRNFDFCAEAEPAETWPYMLWINPSTQAVKVRDKDDAGWITVGGGAGDGAPINAQYLVLALDDTLTAERRFVAGDGLALTDGGANGDATLTVDATIVRTTGAQSISGVKTFADNIVLDDGVGNSPELRFVGGTHGDTVRIYLADDPVAGNSDLYLWLAGTHENLSGFYIWGAGGTNPFYARSDGQCFAIHLITNTIDLNGSPDAMVLDLDGDTTISAPTDDQIDFEVGGADQIHLVDGKLYPDQDNDIDLGDGTHEFKDGYFDGTIYTDAIDMVNAVNEFSTDGTLGDNSDAAVPTEKAVKTYVDGHPGGADGVAVYNDADIAIGTGVWTALTFNQERWDDAAFHSTVANTDRLTVPAGLDGWYVISGHIQWESSVAGTARHVRIFLNDTTRIAHHGGPGDGDMRVSISTVYYLGVGDFLTLEVYHNAGVDLDIVSNANWSPEFRMVCVGK